MRKERAPANVHRNAKVLKVGKKFLYIITKKLQGEGLVLTFRTSYFVTLALRILKLGIG